MVLKHQNFASRVSLLQSEPAGFQTCASRPGELLISKWCNSSSAHLHQVTHQKTVEWHMRPGSVRNSTSQAVEDLGTV